jgi:YHS domain-containing protein
MKNWFILLTFAMPLSLIAQNIDYNQKKGFIAKGYDVVAYFDGTPKAGKSKYTTTHQGAKYKFSTKANLAKFKKNPSQYIPEYGGYCAYAMGKDGSKVAINPKTFKIINGKLYLFYNAYGINTLRKWKKENPKQLKKQADTNWKEVMNAK